LLCPQRNQNRLIFNNYLPPSFQYNLFCFPVPSSRINSTNNPVLPSPHRSHTEITCSPLSPRTPPYITEHTPATAFCMASMGRMKHHPEAHISAGKRVFMTGFGDPWSLRKRCLMLKSYQLFERHCHIPREQHLLYTNLDTVC